MALPQRADVGVVVGAVVAFYALGKQDLWLRVLALLVLLAAALATFFTSETGKQLIAFGRDAVKETKKVVWPTRKETIMTGVMVLIMTSLLGLFFLGVDAFFDAVVRFLLSLAQ